MDYIGLLLLSIAIVVGVIWLIAWIWRKTEGGCVEICLILFIGVPLLLLGIYVVFAILGIFVFDKFKI